ncbi:hypothetical protein BaRGS_00011531, partial [Batillaria attramentaria]
MSKSATDLHSHSFTKQGVRTPNWSIRETQGRNCQSSALVETSRTKRYTLMASDTVSQHKHLCRCVTAHT